MSRLRKLKQAGGKLFSYITECFSFVRLSRKDVSFSHKQVVDRLSIARMVV